MSYSTTDPMGNPSDWQLGPAPAMPGNHLDCADVDGLVWYRDKCIPEYLDSCPAGYPASNVLTGMCVNPDAPNVSGVPPDRIRNPTLPSPITWAVGGGVAGAALLGGIAYLLGGSKVAVVAGVGGAVAGVYIASIQVGNMVHR